MFSAARARSHAHLPADAHQDPAAATAMPLLRAPFPSAPPPCAPGDAPRLPLLPPPRSRRRDGGPWMDLSIRAYFIDPAQPWQSRQYRVCDTSLTLLQQQVDLAGGG